MNNNKLIAIIAALVIVVAGIGAVYILTKDNGSDGDTLTDMRGREVAVPEEINSILAIKSCSLEMVSFFDAVDKVTYVDINEIFSETSDRTHSFILYEKMKDLPAVDPKNAEAVIQSGVDIIISSTIEVSALDKEQTDYGIPVFAINADIEFGEEFNKQLRTLGKLFNESERAEEIISGIDALIDVIELSASTDDITGYACGMNFFQGGKITLLRSTGDYLPFVFSGITNIVPTNPVGNKQPYDVDEEKYILNGSPDYVFVDGMGIKSAEEYIKNNWNVYKDEEFITSKDGFHQTLVYKAWGTNWVNQLINSFYVASVVNADNVDWDFEEYANEVIKLFYPDTDKTYADLANAQTGGGCKAVTL